MAYDERLVSRIREVLGTQHGFLEKKMFGGVCFLFRGNMVCGVIQENLIARVPPAEYVHFLAFQHVKEFAFTGKPMKGWLVVEAKGVATQQDLMSWIDRSMKFVYTLPTK